MKVGELLNKKMDEMSERDFMEFACGIGTQFGVVLQEVLQIESLNEIDQNLLPTLYDTIVVEINPKEYTFVYDVEQLRRQLYNGVA